MTPLAREARELMRRAILTLRALPDVKGPKEFGNAFANLIVHQVEESYGWSGAKAVSFEPEPRDVSIYLTVLGWISWFQREVDAKAKPRDRLVPIFFAWAYEIPMWRLAKQNSCSERTVERRRDGLAETVAIRFADEIDQLRLDRVGNVRQNGQITNKVAESRPGSPGDLPVTPTYVRAVDARPTDLPQSSDRRRTIRRLEKNARRSKREKEQAI